MGYAAISELITTNHLAVFELLEQATDVIVASPHVTHVYVRGSLVHGTADRLSDLDFVAGVTDEQFCDFCDVLDVLMETEFNAILPGWRDSIVFPMGGIGYVYLIESGGKLQQLDFYVLPASRAADIPIRTGARLVFSRELPAAASVAPELEASVERRIADGRTRKPSLVERVVEVLVLALMIRKRIRRGQFFLAYGETHMVRTAVKELVKTALAPYSIYRGWYRLEEELGVTPLGQACVRDLRALVAAPPPEREADLDAMLDRCLRIANIAAPAATEELALGIDAYRAYLEMGAGATMEAIP